MTRYQTPLPRLQILKTLALAFVLSVIAVANGTPASAEEAYESWPLLKSTFESTGGGGILIKGYDPVVTGDRCVTTFMAVEPGPNPAVYANLVEFEAVPVAGGILCRNGKWRAFEGGATGTTPFRMFVKDGRFHAAP